MCIRDRASASVQRVTFSVRLSRNSAARRSAPAVSYTHLRAHETPERLVCRLLLEKTRRPPRSTRVRSSAASDVYKRQGERERPARDLLSEALAEQRGAAVRP